MNLYLRVASTGLFISVVCAFSTKSTTLLPRIGRSFLFRMIPNNCPSHSSPDPDEPLLSSRHPQKLKNGRGTFLGFRNVKDLKAGALMPDGGLSPCVIRVLGVGGGGCNAVSLYSLLYPTSVLHHDTLYEFCPFS
jgi:hypothetical protein